MTPLVIPQDILNSIIDQLTDDRPTLKTCTLLSRFFRYACQTHLFSDIRLKIDEEHRNREFIHILTDHPAIALCVQNLNLQLLYLRWEPPSGSEHEPVVAILPFLLHLQSLQMTYESNYMLVWKGKGELHDAVLHLFKLPTLSRVSLGCIQDFPMNVFLRGCTRLQALAITLVYEPHNVLDNDFNPRPSSILIPKTHLDVLKISTTQNSGRLLQRLMGLDSSIGIQQLRNFEFGRMEQAQDIDDCQMALDGCAETLEVFKVSVASETLALTIGMRSMPLDF